MATSNSPDTRAQEGHVSPMRPAQAFQRHMEQLADSADLSELAPEIGDSIADKILTAQTDDDIWNADLGGTVQARDAVGMEVEIRSMRVGQSTRQDIESKYYATFDAVCMGGPKEVLTRNSLTVGQTFALQTGARHILEKVWAFQARERLPIQAVIVGTTTSSGNEVLTLRPMPERAVRGTAE